MKKFRTIHINAETKTVAEVEAGTLADFQKLVGGLIERGCELENGDEVFVNEEGLLGSPKHFFYITGAHQPFAGNGYITGAPTRTGNTSDAVSDLDWVRDIIMWLTPKDAILVARQLEREHYGPEDDEPSDREAAESDLNATRQNEINSLNRKDF